MNKIIKQAFTLIELLVVIAIIGILSGLIVVAMGGMTTKANIAKAQVFSNSLRNTLMSNLVSEWKLDDASGGTAFDSWSGGNSGSLGSFTSTAIGYGDTNTSGWMSASNCVLGTCLKFDGSTNYVDIADRANLNFGTGSFTVEFWMKANAQTESFPAVIDKSNNGDWTNGGGQQGWIFLWWGSSTNVYRFMIGDASTYNVLSFANYNDQLWKHIAITVSSTTIKGYVNGEAITPINKTILGSPDAAFNLNIGRWRHADRTFNGIIDNVRLYSNAISDSQIKEQYFAGLNSLLASGNISNNEYSERINSIAQQ